MHCTFCSYANGVIAYTREIAARTEQVRGARSSIPASSLPHTSAITCFSTIGDARRLPSRYCRCCAAPWCTRNGERARAIGSDSQPAARLAAAAGRDHQPISASAPEGTAATTGVRRCLAVETAQPAPVDAIAQRRSLDLQQLGGLRLVAVAHFQRPAQSGSTSSSRSRSSSAIGATAPAAARRRRRGRQRRPAVPRAPGTEQDRRGHAADADRAAACTSARSARRRSPARARCPASRSA